MKIERHAVSNYLINVYVNPTVNELIRLLTNVSEEFRGIYDADNDDLFFASAYDIEHVELAEIADVTCVKNENEDLSDYCVYLFVKSDGGIGVGTGVNVDSEVLFKLQSQALAPN